MFSSTVLKVEYFFSVVFFGEPVGYIFNYGEGALKLDPHTIDRDCGGVNLVVLNKLPTLYFGYLVYQFYMKFHCYFVVDL